MSSTMFIILLAVALSLVACYLLFDAIFEKNRKRIEESRGTTKFSYADHVLPKTPPKPPKHYTGTKYRSARPQRSHVGGGPSSHDTGPDVTTLVLTAGLLSDSSPAPKAPETSPCSTPTTDTSSSCFVGSSSGFSGSSSSGFSSSSSDFGSSSGFSGGDSSF